MIYVNSDEDSHESEQDSMFVNVCPVTRRGSKNNSASTTPASDSTATSETRVQTRGMKRRSEPSTSQIANDTLEQIAVNMPRVQRKERVPISHNEKIVDCLVDTILTKEVIAHQTLQRTGRDLGPNHELSTIAEYSQLQEMVFDLLNASSFKDIFNELDELILQTHRLDL